MRAKSKKAIVATKKRGGKAHNRAPRDVAIRAREHQDTTGKYGVGPKGSKGVIVPWGAAPGVAPPPVGAGKGFKGW